MGRMDRADGPAQAPEPMEWWDAVLCLSLSHTEGWRRAWIGRTQSGDPVPDGCHSNVQSQLLLFSFWGTTSELRIRMTHQWGTVLAFCSFGSFPPFLGGRGEILDKRERNGDAIVGGGD